MEINLNLAEFADLLDACSEFNGRFKTDINQKLLKLIEDERANTLQKKRELADIIKKDFTDTLRELVANDEHFIERCRDIISRYDNQMKSLSLEIQEIENL